MLDPDCHIGTLPPTLLVVMFGQSSGGVKFYAVGRGRSLCHPPYPSPRHHDLVERQPSAAARWPQEVDARREVPDVVRTGAQLQHLPSA